MVRNETIGNVLPFSGTLPKNAPSGYVLLILRVELFGFVIIFLYEFERNCLIFVIYFLIVDIFLAVSLNFRKCEVSHHRISDGGVGGIFKGNNPELQNVL